MPGVEKVLWTVHYDDVDAFLDQAQAVGASSVAVRTDNDLLKVIANAHQRGVKVYGWRWPATLQAFLTDEVDRATSFFAAGMDGYYCDPEAYSSDALNWDRLGLAATAADFCKKIVHAASGQPFGVTSHYRGKFAEPNLPWSTFFNYATVLLPQAYWRSSEGVIGHGIPADNYNVSIDSWVKTGAAKAKIEPMAGELACASPGEIAEYAKAAASAGVTTLHFYAYEAGVKQAVWDAIAAI